MTDKPEAIHLDEKRQYSIGAAPAVMKRDQGEPLEKEKIKERFYEILERSADPQTDPELISIRLILQSVMQMRW